MASELDRQRARIAQLESDIGPLAARESMDLAYYKRRALQLRAEKNRMLAAEKQTLAQEYETRLFMERQMLHERLQRELAFRERNDLTTSTKHSAYGGLLNPPKLGGDTVPKTEAQIKAAREFKTVAEDSIPGYVVTRVLGAVSGSAYVAGSPEPELENVDFSRSDRSRALGHMVETAINRGANAVIGLRFDTSAPIGTAHIEILAYGTAVNIKRDNGKGQNWDSGHKHGGSKDESLTDMLKRLLADEDGGGKKKNKQPEPADEDQLTFSQIEAITALLANKGGASGGGGEQGGVWGGTTSGWGSSGNNNNTAGWGDPGVWGNNNNAGWDTGGGSSSNNCGKEKTSWSNSNDRDNDRQGGQSYSNYGSGGNSGSWGGYDYGRDGEDNDDDTGGWGSNRRRNRNDSPYSPDIDPREVAFVLSDLMQRRKRSGGRSSSRRPSTRSYSRDSPMFGWETF